MFLPTVARSSRIISFQIDSDDTVKILRLTKLPTVTAKVVNETWYNLFPAMRNQHERDERPWEMG